MVHPAPTIGLAPALPVLVEKLCDAATAQQPRQRIFRQEVRSLRKTASRTTKDVTNDAPKLLPSNRTASPGLAPSDTRQCSICKELKSPDEFIRDARRASGLDARCKLCRRQQHHNRKMQHLAAGGVPTVAQKECTRCHVVKPASGFKRHSYTNSGLDSWCKACCSERRREKGRGERVQEPTVASKECSVCRQTKTAPEFTRDTGKRTGLGTRCKLCEAEYRRQQRKKYKLQAAAAAAAASTPPPTHTNQPHDSSPSTPCTVVRSNPVKIPVPMVGLPVPGSVQHSPVLEPAATPKFSPQCGMEQSQQVATNEKQCQQPSVWFQTGTTSVISPQAMAQQEADSAHHQQKLPVASGCTAAAVSHTTASSAASSEDSSVVAWPAPTASVPTSELTVLPPHAAATPQARMVVDMAWPMADQAAAAPSTHNLQQPAPAGTPETLDEPMAGVLDSLDSLGLGCMGSSFSMDGGWRTGGLALPFDSLLTPSVTPMPTATTAGAEDAGAGPGVQMAATPADMDMDLWGNGTATPAFGGPPLSPTFTQPFNIHQDANGMGSLEVEAGLDEDALYMRPSSDSTAAHVGWVVSTNGAGHTEAAYTVPDAALGTPVTLPYAPAELPALFHTFYPSPSAPAQAPLQQQQPMCNQQQLQFPSRPSTGMGGSVFSDGPAAFQAAAVAAAGSAPFHTPSPGILAAPGVFPDGWFAEGSGYMGELGGSWGALLRDGSMDLKMLPPF